MTRSIANVLGPRPPDVRLNRRDGYFRPTESCGSALGYSLLSWSTKHLVACGQGLVCGYGRRPVRQPCWWEHRVRRGRPGRPGPGCASDNPSSPSEDYLAVLAGQRQWIATTNFAGCPSRPPDSFANSAVLTTSAKFLMRWAGPSARAFLCRLTPKRNSLSRLWPVQISDHSPFTFSSPRSKNCRNPGPA